MFLSLKNYKFHSRHGFSCPANYNPADFFIRTLAITPGSENSSKMRIKRLCDEFTVSDNAREVEQLVEQVINSKSADKDVSLTIKFEIYLLSQATKVKKNLFFRKRRGK